MEKIFAKLPTYTISLSLWPAYGGEAGFPVKSATPLHKSVTLAFCAAVLAQLLSTALVVSNGTEIAVGNGSTTVKLMGATG